MAGDAAAMAEQEAPQYDVAGETLQDTQLTQPLADVQALNEALVQISGGVDEKFQTASDLFNGFIISSYMALSAVGAVGPQYKKETNYINPQLLLNPGLQLSTLAALAGTIGLAGLSVQ